MLKIWDHVGGKSWYPDLLTHVSRSGPLLECGHYFLGQEFQTPIRRFLGQGPTGIQVNGNAGDPKLLLKLGQAVNDASRATENYLGL